MAERIIIERYRAPGGLGAHMPGATTTAYRVSDTRGPGDVNFRMHRLWRADNRYHGVVCVRRHETGGLELSFDALRHGAKPRPPVVVAEAQVRAFILSCLECCRPDDGEAPMAEAAHARPALDLIYRSQGRRFAVWVTLGEEAIVAVAATDGHPLDVAPFAVLGRDEAAALHADLGAWLEATA